MRALFVCFVVACGSGSPAKEPPPQPGSAGSASAQPAAALPAGPVPVQLPALPAAQLRTLTKVDGFLIVDAHGAVRWGRAPTGATPYAGTPLQRGDDAYSRVLFKPPPTEPTFRAESTLAYGGDSYATLARDGSVEAVVLADAAAPARIAMAEIQALGFHAVALAAGAGNTAVLYTFGREPWESNDPDLTLRVDQLDKLGTAPPRRIALEIDDRSTVAELATALAALAAAKVEHVRLHRMMGWGDIPPSEIVALRGAGADDDQNVAGDPAYVEIGEPKVDAKLHAEGVETALSSFSPRFRYCFEKRGQPKLHGAVQLAFDVAADGTIANAKAKGLDPKIASCVAGAVFDLDITPRAIEGAGHVSVQIKLSANTPTASTDEPPEKPSGFWCFTAGDVGLCAREEAQCEAARGGFNQANDALKGGDSAKPCAAQDTAWTSDGTHYQPTKQLCGKTCKSSR